MHCGFLPRSEWEPGRRGLPKTMGPDPYTADACPGWLVRAPAVTEAAMAYDALDARALHLLDPLERRVVFEAAMAMKRSLNVYQTARTKQLAKRAGR